MNDSGSGGRALLLRSLFRTLFQFTAESPTFLQSL
jgi:hypothetical protein